MKAFISYSSDDKNFCDAVVKKLGRQYCIVDTISFNSGEELFSAIDRCLDESSIYVLLASSNSLKSMWVEHEISEARMKLIERKIVNSLSIIIDQDVSVSDLPKWLKKNIVPTVTNAQQASREIQDFMYRVFQKKQHPFFVGRSSEQRRLEEVITMGKPPALPGDSQSLTVPGIIESLRRLNRSKLKLTEASGERVRKPMPLRMGLQVPCGLDTQVS